MQVKPLTGALGAEIFALDLAQPLSESNIHAIKQAFWQHQVIFFRDQALTPDQLCQFARHFGELADYPFANPYARSS